MTPQRFTGSTSREVLQKVKQSLGDDALIVSNGTCDEGIEIMALPASALEAQARPAGATPRMADTEGMVAYLMREMGSMKSMLRQELAGIAWSSLRHTAPARAAAMQALLNAGFSAALARELIAMVDETGNGETTRKAIVAEIARRLPLVERDSIVEDGGVYALVGPTGVGKTTTIAKLAARCVVRHGAASLALLTTDSYRIAGHDQLRVYGKILNVPVHAIKDAGDLNVTLAELRGKRTVLVDTIGMSQRDRMVTEQTALLMGGGAVMKRLLLLNATSNAATLDEVVRAYAMGGVQGCIITKVDESASVATAIDCAMRHQLKIHYVTNGQRVPEDLHLPNSGYLLHRALQPIKDTAAHGLLPEEFPMVMTAEEAASPGVLHA